MIGVDALHELLLIVAPPYVLFVDSVEQRSDLTREHQPNFQIAAICLRSVADVRREIYLCLDLTTPLRLGIWLGGRGGILGKNKGNGYASSYGIRQKVTIFCVALLCCFLFILRLE